MHLAEGLYIAYRPDDDECVSVTLIPEKGKSHLNRPQF
jgi:hypothetical protein